MTSRRQFTHHAIGLAASLGGIGAAPGLCPVVLAQAGAYPSRVIRIIVPYAAGGGPDLLARAMATRLAEVIGKPVVVQNIVGAGGIVAAQSFVQMAPDGYNILLGASSHVVQKAMQPDLKFDPMKDFAHIVRIAFSPSILVVSAASPIGSLGELVAAAKQSPGRFNYASGGIGSAAHLSAAAMSLKAGIDVVHVPYKGSVEIVPSIVSGDTHFAFPIASTAIPQIRAGKVRALAVTSLQRMPAFKNVPTLVEALDAAELALDAWFGLWAPAGTPPEIVRTLAEAVARVYDDPALRASSEAAGAQVALSGSPSEFTRFIGAETQKFGRIVASARLGVER